MRVGIPCRARSARRNQVGEKHGRENTTRLDASSAIEFENLDDGKPYKDKNIKSESEEEI